MKKRSKNGIIKTLLARGKADTPPFFKKLRLIGLALTTVGGVLVASPVTLPAMVVTVAGYMVVAGGIASAICQVTVKNEESF